jgi:hypothetical protein
MTCEESSQLILAQIISKKKIKSFLRLIFILSAIIKNNTKVLIDFRNVVKMIYVLKFQCCLLHVCFGIIFNQELDSYSKLIIDK